MNILGITGPIHDTSAALIVDGVVVAAVEEERFTRKKHAYKTAPEASVRYCLEVAGLKPEDIDVIAYPWSLEEFKKNSSRQLIRSVSEGVTHALSTYVKLGKRFSKYQKKIHRMLETVGFDLDKVEWMDVPHHVAHGASSYYLSGFKKAAVMTVDALGEYISTQFAVGDGKDFKVLKNYYMPDSFGCFYTTMTEFLGFESNNGEYKLMGMAPYGDADKVDLSEVAWVDEEGFHVNSDYIWVSRKKSYEGKLFSQKLIDKLGPPREGDGLKEPYIHIAAAVQKTLEEGVISLMEKNLTEVLEETGQLAFAGGCALNVSLNRLLIDHPLVETLWVQPAANDAGTSLGAAVYAAAQLGEEIQPMETVYLGPEFSDEEIEAAFEKFKVPFEKCDNIEERGAELLANGEMLAWMQGRMEFGPRSLGNRAILGSPKKGEMADTINAAVKFREKWRPFCPSILEEYAEEILQTSHDSSFMNFSFKINKEWHEKIPEVVHVDGTGRPQVVREKHNKRFYDLMKCFHKKTGIPVLINTSLNVRGEPVVCTPIDALNNFFKCGLEFMAIGDYLVTKRHQ
jgi:carbamoyltransferase